VLIDSTNSNSIGTTEKTVSFNNSKDTVWLSTIKKSHCICDYMPLLFANSAHNHILFVLAKVIQKPASININY
jgi:hypothetical protein